MEMRRARLHFSDSFAAIHDLASPNHTPLSPHDLDAKLNKMRESVFCGSDGKRQANNQKH